MYWLLGSKSQLSIESKLLLYEAILKPIWTYSVQSSVSLGHSRQFKHGNNSKISKRIPQNHCTNDTSPMILYAMISTYHMLEMKLKSSDRDTPTDWTNNTLAIDLMSDAEILRGLKRILSQDLYKV